MYLKIALTMTLFGLMSGCVVHYGHHARTYPAASNEPVHDATWTDVRWVIWSPRRRASSRAFG